MLQQYFDEALDELFTIIDLTRWITSRFNASDLYFGHGTDNAYDEAISLVMYALSLPFEAFDAVNASRVTRSEKIAILTLVQTRIEERKPLAYLTNHARFCGLDFYVDERVLVPRSPIAELINDQFSSLIDASKVQRALDMCTGSGCIAIAMGYALPHAVIDAVDISFDALAVAELNIEQHDLMSQVFPIQSDLFESVQGMKYDLIVSNPPYVDAEDLEDMPSEYHHEPEIGLGSGEDGLLLTRKMLANAAEHLSDTGVLVVEVGNSMVHLAELFPSVPFEWLDFTHGGHGVFVLTREQIIQHQDTFGDAVINS